MGTTYSLGTFQIEYVVIIQSLRNYFSDSSVIQNVHAEGNKTLLVANFRSHIVLMATKVGIVLSG
jgi:hypothetical protein